MKRLSIITLADLGAKTNLKTIDILPVIERFSEEGELESIACRINSGFEFPETYSVIPYILHAFLKACELFSMGKLSARLLEESVFDRLAVKKIMPSSLVIFHPEYFFRKSAANLRRKKVITIGIATMATLSLNAQLEKEESNLLALKEPEHYYQDMLDKNGPVMEFDYAIATSDFVKMSLIDAGYDRDRIFMAAFDVNIAMQNHPDLEKKFRVVYTAHTSMLKGLHYLLSAWKSVNLPNKELVILGGFDGLPRDLKMRYEKIIQEDPTMRFVGNVARSELAEYYRNAAIFAFPSLTEGNPKVVIEALSYGLPVITTTNAQGPVVDGENGFVTPIRDSRSLAEKIQLLGSDRELWRKMSDAAIASVESKTSFGEEVFVAYQEICRREGLTR